MMSGCPTSTVEGPTSHHDLDIPSSRCHGGCGGIVPVQGRGNV
jgi:hypothetical protein